MKLVKIGQDLFNDYPSNNFRYQDDDGNWRNEYDDEGYEFAEDEFDLDEAEELTKAQNEEDRAKAEAERQLLALESAGPGILKCFLQHTLLGPLGPNRQK